MLPSPQLAQASYHASHKEPSQTPLFMLHTTLVLGMVTLSTCYMSVALPRSLSAPVFLSGGQW